MLLHISGSEQLIDAVPKNTWITFDDLPLLNLSNVTQSCFPHFTSLHCIFGSRFVQMLKELHLCIVGCGAAGVEMLKNLAISEIGSVIHVFDSDKVSSTNIPRSIIFTEQDINCLKTEVASSAICAKFAKNVNIVPHPYFVTLSGTSTFPECDFVISCADTFNGRSTVNSICNFLEIPWTDLGVTENGAMSRYYHPLMTCDYSCDPKSIETEKIKRALSCTERANPTTSAHYVQWAVYWFRELFTYRTSSLALSCCSQSILRIYMVYRL